jgi:hypothetical protein
MDFVKPSGDELIITKNVNPAFIGTNLERVLLENLEFVGYVWNDDRPLCVDFV